MAKARVTKAKLNSPAKKQSTALKSKQNMSESKQKAVTNNTNKNGASERLNVTWFRCDKCNFGSRLLKVLERHKISHIEESLPILLINPCEFCGKKFRKLARLELHKLDMHRDMKAHSEDPKQHKSPQVPKGPVENPENAAKPQKRRLTAAEDCERLLRPHKIRITSVRDDNSHETQDKTESCNKSYNVQSKAAESCDRQLEPDNTSTKNAEVSQMPPKFNKVKLKAAKDSETLKSNKIRITSAENLRRSHTPLESHEMHLKVVNDSTVPEPDKIKTTAEGPLTTPVKPHKIWLKDITHKEITHAALVEPNKTQITPEDSDINLKPHKIRIKAAEDSGDPLKPNEIRLKLAEKSQSLRRPHKVKLKLAEDTIKTYEVAVTSTEMSEDVNSSATSQNTSDLYANIESPKKCVTPDSVVSKKLDNKSISNDDSDTFLDPDSNDGYEPHDTAYDDCEPQNNLKHDYYAKNTTSFHNYGPHINKSYKQAQNDMADVDFEAILKPHQIGVKSSEIYKKTLLQRHMVQDFENLLKPSKILQHIIDKEAQIVLVRCDDLINRCKKSSNRGNKMKNTLTKAKADFNETGRKVKKTAITKRVSIAKPNLKSLENNIVIKNTNLKNTITQDKPNQNVKNKTAIKNEKKKEIHKHNIVPLMNSIPNNKRLTEYNKMQKILNKKSGQERMKEKTRRGNNREFICDNCDYKTHRKPLLRIHMVKHLGTLPYRCQLCNFKTSWKSSLKLHMVLHTGNKYSCDQCGFQTLHLSNLKRHMKTHFKRQVWNGRSKNKRLPCDICKLCFKNQQALENHKAYCTLEVRCAKELHKCDKCDFTTNYLDILNIHLETHKKQILTCDTCTYKTSSKWRLQKHSNKHSNDMPFACNLCKFRCKRENTYNQHMEKHKPPPFVQAKYYCNVCDKKFREYIRYQTHVKSHESKKESDVAEVVLEQCPLCDYKSKNKYDVKNHMRIHTGVKPYSCEFCPYRASFSNHMNVHMRQHTGERPYVCKVCGSTFVQVGSLSRHMKTHIPKEAR